MAGESFAGLAPLQGTPTSSRTSTMTDEAEGLLDVVANRQFPSRLEGWRAALQALTERASGSPAAMEGLLSPALQEMAQKLLATNAKISRTFGPYGGNQTPAAMGQAAAGLDLPGLYSNAAMKAGQQRQNFLGGTSIIAPQGQNVTQTTQQPIDLGKIAQAYAGVLQSAASAYGGARGLMNSAPSWSNSTLPTTMAEYNAGGYSGASYKPFGAYPDFGNYPAFGDNPGVGFGPAQGYPYL